MLPYSRGGADIRERTVHPEKGKAKTNKNKKKDLYYIIILYNINILYLKTILFTALWPVATTVCLFPLAVS